MQIFNKETLLIISYTNDHYCIDYNTEGGFLVRFDTEMGDIELMKLASGEINSTFVNITEVTKGTTVSLSGNFSFHHSLFLSENCFVF